MNLSQKPECVKPGALPFQNLRCLYDAAVARVGAAVVLAELAKPGHPDKLPAMLSKLAAQEVAR